MIKYENIKNLTKYTYQIILILILSIFIFKFFKIQIHNSNLEKENKELIDTINQKDKEIDSIRFQFDSLKNDYDSLYKDVIIKKDLKSFLNKISMRESSGNHSIVNKYGMMGLYQFKKSTLQMLGIHVDDRLYLNDIDLQNYSMIENMKFNKKVLGYYINKYNGKYHKGVKITPSGLLAGAHLTGPGSIIEFFEDTGKYKTVDGNGVDVSEYIKEFANYDIMASLIN